MDCKRCREELTAYLDGELSQADAAQVHAHVEICASCAAELRSFQKAARFIEENKRELELSAESWNRVYARISEESASSASIFSFLSRWSFALASATAIIVFAVGFLLYQRAEKRSLDEYISQYIKAREVRQTIQLSLSGTGAGFTHSNAVNPFTEIKEAFETNPFRSEDR